MNAVLLPMNSINVTWLFFTNKHRHPKVLIKVKVTIIHFMKLNGSHIRRNN